MSRLLRSSFFSSLAATCLCLGLAHAGAGCGKSKGKAKPASEKATSAGAKEPVARPVPDRIHLTFEQDPGFWVPLEALDKFDSFNRMLPGEMRSVTTWASIEMTMADGTKEVVKAPKEKFGEAGYQLRAADPGISLVAFDKETNAVRATWGPLASLHVTPTESANSQPKPFPIVIDGKHLMVAPEKLASLATVTEPNKKKPAWKLGSLAADLKPGCVLSALEVTGEKEPVELASEHLSKAYLRSNRRGVWMVSLVADDGTPIRERVFGVTRMEAKCATKAKK